MFRFVICVAAWVVLLADFALAHPGHGATDPDAVAHYVVEPAHALPLLLIGAGIIGVWRLARRDQSAGAWSDVDPDKQG